MSGWDVAIYAVFVLWIAAVVSAVIAVMKIVNGPGARVARRGKSILEAGKELAATGKRVVSANQTPIRALIADLRAIGEDVRLEAGHTVFAAEPINYAKITKLFATLRTVRGGLQTLSRFRRRKSTAAAVAASAARPSKAKSSLVEKLGLIPPAARHLAPALRVAKIVWQTHRQLRQRGLL